MPSKISKQELAGSRALRLAQAFAIIDVLHLEGLDGMSQASKVARDELEGCLPPGQFLTFGVNPNGWTQGFGHLQWNLRQCHRRFPL